MLGKRQTFEKTQKDKFETHKYGFNTRSMRTGIVL